MILLVQSVQRQMVLDQLIRYSKDHCCQLTNDVSIVNVSRTRNDAVDG